MILHREKIIKIDGKDCVDVRSYEADEAIKRKKPIRVVVRDRYMDLSIKQLKKPVAKSAPIHSKIYKDQYYKLYSYEWKDTKPIKLSPEQEREELRRLGVYI